MEQHNSRKFRNEGVKNIISNTNKSQTKKIFKIYNANNNISKIIFSNTFNLNSDNIKS